MNKFYVIIYHPSRFTSLTPINILIYRYLNSVIDTSKMGKSITLSITIWGYPSRFSHYTLSHTTYHCWKACNGWHQRRLRFHGMKYFVSFHETVCFKRRNTSFHPVKRTDTCGHQSFCPYRVTGLRRNYPGRCPGLGASAPSGRVGQN